MSGKRSRGRLYGTCHFSGVVELSTLWTRRQKLGNKFRQCELQKVPYKIIVGEKEMVEDDRKVVR
ncbi:MAG: His/Gly/Thr/Pro-type tRNA ligase C-terminal domain-containing protein [Fibrobacter sp.]|nr:His/Gly/Thr/Pro-type tRNA ligase C-terminal domain-containing protein [Fibrobacter sp.]